MSKTKIEEYTAQQAHNIRTCQGTVAEVELMRRWHYDPNDERRVKAFKKRVWELRSGRHACGVRLVPLNIDAQHRVYLVEDIAQVELALKAYSTKRLDRQKK